MRMNWEKYGIKPLTGIQGTERYFAPNVMSNAVTSGTKAFQSTLKRESSTVTTAGSLVVRLKKSRGRKKTARGGTQHR